MRAEACARAYRRVAATRSRVPIMRSDYLQPQTTIMPVVVQL